MVARPYSQRLLIRDFAKVILLCALMATATLVAVTARSERERVDVLMLVQRERNPTSDSSFLDVGGAEDRRGGAAGWQDAASAKWRDGKRKPDPLSLVVYYDKLFLAAAYADFNEPVPKLRMTAFGRHNFKGRLYCKYGGRSYRAYGTFINYSNGMIAQWRAIYFTCSVPDLQEPIAEITIGDDGNAARDVTLPVRGGSPRRQSSSSPSPPPRQFLGVCVKSAYGVPDARRVVEWMELNALLGVDHVILYNASMGAAADATFQHYVDRGYLTVVQDEVRRWLVAHNASFGSLFDSFDATYSTGSEPHPQTQLLSLQDCYHRFRRDFEYILVVDLDEILVPTSERTLPELIRGLARRHPAAGAFSFLAAEYLEDYGRASDGGGLHALAHTRHSLPTYEQVKTVHRTKDTVAINWHKRLLPADGYVAVRGDSAWVHHYRKRCKGAVCSSRRWYDDGAGRMGRYAADLLAASARTLAALEIA